MCRWPVFHGRHSGPTTHFRYSAEAARRQDPLGICHHFPHDLTRGSDIADQAHDFADQNVGDIEILC